VKTMTDCNYCGDSYVESAEPWVPGVCDPCSGAPVEHVAWVPAEAG